MCRRTGVCIVAVPSVSRWAAGPGTGRAPPERVPAPRRYAMSCGHTLTRVVTTLTSLAGLGLSACDTAPLAPPAAGVAAVSSLTTQRALGAAVNKDLAALRRLTASFHNFEKAAAAGWSVQLTECLEIPLGAQGFHYANVAYIDGEANLLEPELLLYEPQRNGRLRLVGVEYIVPLTAWTSS